MTTKAKARFKVTFLCLTGVVSFALAGCQSVGRIVDGLPRGKFEELTYSRAGNTSTAEISLKGVDSTDLYFKADAMDATFTNPLTGRVKLTAKGYQRVRGPTEQPSHPSPPDR